MRVCSYRDRAQSEGYPLNVVRAGHPSRSERKDRPIMPVMDILIEVDSGKEPPKKLLIYSLSYPEKTPPYLAGKEPIAIYVGKIRL